MEGLYQTIKEGKQIRENLAELRKRIKEPGEKEKLMRLLAADTAFFQELFGEEDPKVRKNAALLIGDLDAQEQLAVLYEAYQREETLFVRSAYLKAMERLDVQDYMEGLRKRQQELMSREVSEENRKHYREELLSLERLLEYYLIREKHLFRGHEKTWNVLLTTNRLYREVTARQVHGKKISLVPLGVKVLSADLSRLMRIRTWHELLFLLDIGLARREPEEAAEDLMGSNLLAFLERAHGPMEQCRFRISIQGKMPLDRRSDFIKKCSFALEEMSGRRLMNSASDYEVELRLLERKDGTFLPLLKLYTLKDERFSYRKSSIAASIRPQTAALLAELARPYLKEGAQVLDPFCGVGTMLIERDKAVAAGPMYGIDIFGEAIRKARENTECAGREIYYVNRDFFEFTHKYLFDEIFTNPPVRGKKSREEQEQLYQQLFEQAEVLLRPGSRMFLYSNEKGYVKKQLRLRKRWGLVKEFAMDEKEAFFLYVIELREKS